MGQPPTIQFVLGGNGYPLPGRQVLDLEGKARRTDSLAQMLQLRLMSPPEDFLIGKVVFSKKGTDGAVCKQEAMFAGKHGPFIR